MSSDPFFNEAAREAAARAAFAELNCEHGGELATFAGFADRILNAALEALPERSKAILALAALSDEELVALVVPALAVRSGSYRDDATRVLTALGLPVARRAREPDATPCAENAAKYGQEWKRERDCLRKGIVALYVEAPVAVARVCDEVIDRSGRLLGEVRAEARALQADPQPRSRPNPEAGPDGS